MEPFKPERDIGD
jgi:hypothetical protein